ncbi:MAG: AbrB/MazE/SpoVT family DNA-binding domain-containing protein [Candidatus Helarchaeota archaeon]
MSNKISETRKLVKWGSSKTLIMSLPRNWTKKHNLSEKNEVQVFENSDGSLLIMPFIMGDSESKLVTTIVADKYPEISTLSYIIQTAYLDGNDVIRIETKSPFTQEKYMRISKLVSDLLGFEILSKTPNVIIIKDIMALKETSLNELIKMVSRNVLELMENLIYSIEQKDPSIIDAIISSKEHIQKYYLRVHRQLRKGLIQPSILMKMDINSQDAVDFAFFIVHINDIAGYLASMGRAMAKYKTVENIEFTLQVLKETYDLLKEGVVSFLFRKTTDAINVLDQVEKIKNHKREVENELDSMSSKSPATACQIILDNSEKIIEFSRLIALAALRRAL